MEEVTIALKRLLDFRLEEYASFTRRADALFELLEALLLASIIRSADDVSQSANFRRRFASVYDDWDNGKIDPLVLRQALVARLLFCNKWRRDVPSRASQGPA